MNAVLIPVAVAIFAYVNGFLSGMRQERKWNAAHKGEDMTPTIGDKHPCSNSSRHSRGLTDLHSHSEGAPAQVACACVVAPTGRLHTSTRGRLEFDRLCAWSTDLWRWHAVPDFDLAEHGRFWFECL